MLPPVRLSSVVMVLMLTMDETRKFRKNEFCSDRKFW